jgi:hypothetical protein
MRLQPFTNSFFRPYAYVAHLSIIFKFAVVPNLKNGCSNVKLKRKFNHRRSKGINAAIKRSLPTATKLTGRMIMRSVKEDGRPVVCL